MMGGQIDWSALPLLIEMLGVEDVYCFISELVAIREHFEMVKENAVR